MAEHGEEDSSLESTGRSPAPARGRRQDAVEAMLSRRAMEEVARSAAPALGRAGGRRQGAVEAQPLRDEVEARPSRWAALEAARQDLYDKAMLPSSQI